MCPRNAKIALENAKTALENRKNAKKENKAEHALYCPNISNQKYPKLKRHLPQKHYESFNILYPYFSNTYPKWRPQGPIFVGARV